MRILLLLISILPVIIFGGYIYLKDKNKEPIKLLTKFFLLGIVSGVIVILFCFLVEKLFPNINNYIEKENINYIKLFIHTFIYIGFIEEFFKWIFTYKLGYNNKEFDELYDMIVYAVFTALGFALLENIFYVFMDGGVIIGVSRGLLAVPAHMCFAIFMGYYLSMAKYSGFNNNYKLERVNKVKSILVPTLLHGIYDYCCFAGSYFVIIFFVFIIILYILSYWKIKYTLSIISKVKYDKNYCSNCGSKVVGDYCVNCGVKH